MTFFQSTSTGVRGGCACTAGTNHQSTRNRGTCQATCNGNANNRNTNTNLAQSTSIILPS